MNRLKKKICELTVIIFLAIFFVITQTAQTRAAEETDEATLKAALRERIEAAGDIILSEGVDVSDLNIPRSDEWWDYMTNVVNDVVSDYPFNVYGLTISIENDKVSQVWASVHWEYSNDDGTLNTSLVERLKIEVEEALACVEPEMSDIEKVVVIHEYVTTEFDYDYLNYLNDTIPSESYSWHGALLNKTCVCAGYAETMSKLLEQVGIESIYVVSEDMNHAWNLVNIDGEWYHLDATWDDWGEKYSDNYISRESKIYHDYFLKSDEEFKDLSHYGWEEDLPDATNSWAFAGYIFDVTDSRLNYHDGYWYYFEEDYWNAYNDYVIKSKIDGSDMSYIDITGYSSYVVKYDDKLYYPVTEESGEYKGINSVYSYALDTGEEELVFDITGTYPGYYISEFVIKDRKMVLVLDSSTSFNTRRIIIDPEKLGEEIVLADSIAVFNRMDNMSVILKGNNDAGQLTFESSDTSIATVDENGIVTMLEPGTTEITVKDVNGNVVKICQVTLDDVFFMEDMYITNAPESVGVGDIVELRLYTGNDYNAIHNVIWSSSDESVATVDSEGVVTAVASGKVTITAYDTDSRISTSCDIVIVDAVPVTGVSLNAEKIVINKYGQIEQLIVTVYPENATNKKITWVDNCISGCDVFNEHDVKIDTRDNGVCIVTVTTEDGGYTASCEIVVDITEYEGVDYSDVFDHECYKYYHGDDVGEINYRAGEALKYFVEKGMALGHQAKDTFSLSVYKEKYADLVAAYGNDNTAYYNHYMSTGKAEGRTAFAGVVIDETNFPDEIFRNYIKSEFDITEGTEGVLSDYEISLIERIYIPYGQRDIRSLKGIEYFSDLTYLDCQDTKVAEIDVSKNTKLERLVCDDSGITSLDLSNNTELEYLTCDNTDISNLDVSKNTKLYGISCKNTNITSLDISSNIILEWLHCDNTAITSLDVSNNTILETLDCNNTGIMSLDLSNNKKMSHLECEGSALTNIKLGYKISWFKVSDNVYDLGKIGKTYSLDNIPGFDVTKASDWTGSTYVDGKLTDFTSNTITYIYDCGYDCSVKFTLTAEIVEVDEMETEGVVGFVNRMYTTILERTPDADSQTWVDLLLDGSYTGASVAEGFIMSNEFLNKNISNEEFVKIMYRAFFGREADEGGLVTWKGCLDEGYIKKFVFAGFANSDEFKALCDTYGIECGVINLTLAEKTPNLSEQDFNIWQFVERLYSEVMGRNPDQTGMDTWVGVLKAGTYTGAQVAEGFILSDEFLNKDMTNDEFVRIMYRAFFNRDADSAGFETWINALETGWTKDAVFAGFANSDEFGRICDEYGIIQGSVETE